VVLPVTVETPTAEAGPMGGAIGVGTWRTQAEFKDIRVTRGGEMLFACDFADGTRGWRLLGGGKWAAEGGVLRQTSEKENIRAVAGDRGWADYTYSLKARKLGGAEGFLILFGVQKDSGNNWWNLGGWGNRQHGIERGGIVTQTPGEIETGRWYDIRIEHKGANIKCYLDGKLIHDVNSPGVKALHASASRVNASGEVILKVVNAAAAPVTADVALKGVERLNGPAQAIVLTSDKPEDENTLDEPTKVVPKAATVNVGGPSFRHEFPGNSLTILRFNPTN
jgi:alpha-L-arabinofuranosidase